jgi:curli biogenesis system outer membrane secretion channel CsgG
MGTMHRAVVMAGVLGMLAISSWQPAQASFSNKGSRAQQQRQAATAQLPVCDKPLGTLSVVEPANGTHWWTGYQLPEPSRLIKAYVSRSRCFTLVDRGSGMAASQYERELGAQGQLRNRSNIGQGQVRAADYVMVPDLVSQNADAGGNAIGGLLSGLVGGRAGQLVAGMNLRSKTADVLLSVTDVRSSEQVAIAEGSARKNDISFSGRGSSWGSNWSSAGVGGYANTEMGQVIAMAYLNAYSGIVAQLGGLPAEASSANAQQAMRMLRAGRLLSDARGSGQVRSLEAGMLLYPLGGREGLLIEVEDELGNRGWISSESVELAR